LAFAEAVTTFGTKLPVLAELDVSGLRHPKLAPEYVQQYMQGGAPHILGIQGGTLSTTLYLAGHGSTTAGATSAQSVETFLGLVLGTTVVSASSGDTLTGGTVSVPTTTGASGFAAGSLAPIGVLGDGRGNGQFYAVGTHSANNLNLLTALDGAPSNGDVLYSAVNMHLKEDPTDAGFTSVRFRFMSANLRYLAHGCYPTALTLSGLNTGQVAKARVDWGVARWAKTTGGTFPSTLSSDAFTPAANAAGSLFVQDVGTTTRAKQVFRDLEIRIGLGNVALEGPGGVSAYQGIVGCRRQPTTIELSWTKDADTVTATPELDTMFAAETAKHILLTLNPTIGKRVGFYMPRLYFSGDHPVQTNQGGINRQRITGMAHTGPTTTSALTLSALRMAFA
jgi:hypothetical protein